MQFSHGSPLSFDCVLHCKASLACVSCTQSVFFSLWAWTICTPRSCRRCAQQRPRSPCMNKSSMTTYHISAWVFAGSGFWCICRSLQKYSTAFQFYRLQSAIRLLFDWLQSAMSDFTERLIQFWSCAQGRILTAHQCMFHGHSKPVPYHLLPNAQIKQQIAETFASGDVQMLQDHQWLLHSELSPLSQNNPKFLLMTIKDCCIIACLQNQRQAVQLQYKDWLGEVRDGPELTSRR